MVHLTSQPHGTNLRVDLLIAIAVTAVISFAAGQNWTQPTSFASTEIEDWHGNVKRSNWPN
ncbi:hypothetical protein [Ruegeria faecimaris]|uniref:Uncharacterized protein n=1 Tax=Ruegeria faecimaris TaxID=686389 RepID=A0A521AKP9_9RHOB|nr:hypothetical protein [Ruegeria faecimaris]SMO35424.1 hypothetical protein SAMN06265380_101193 [Ruegeria faecimaris]